jgi:hypothetical protein
MGRISPEHPPVAKAKALFCRTYGTTEVVPFYKAIYETGSREFKTQDC